MTIKLTFHGETAKYLSGKSVHFDKKIWQTVKDAVIEMKLRDEKLIDYYIEKHNKSSPQELKEITK